MTQRRYYPNMDVARYLMAFLVLIGHFNGLTGSDVFINLTAESVGGFFALSGFLMYPSFLKARNIRQYIGDRARRILPPYVFTVILCAFGLSLFSSLPATDYFSNSEFWEYLAANLTFLNWLHPGLPGVFQGPDFAHYAVNGSLWTMKVEWCLYLSVPIMIWAIGKFRWNSIGAMVAVIVVSILYRFGFTLLYEQTENQIFEILGRQIFGQLSYFYCGMLVYFAHEWFDKYRRYIFIVSLLLYIATRDVPYASVFAAPMLYSCIVLSFSMFRHAVPWMSRSNNISYNIYLLHYPIIQIAVYFGVNPEYPWLPLAGVVVATCLLSIVSISFVEKPFRRRPSGK